MFDRILIPLDGSPESEKIRYWVVGLAAKLKSVVDLLAVIDPAQVKPRPNSGGSQTHEEYLQEETDYAHRYLRTQVEWFQERDVSVAPHVVTGDPAHEIVSQAYDLDAKLIAMVTRRKSAVARGVLGSVADRVLHSTGVPIMLARPGVEVGFDEDGGLPNTVIVPLDRSNFSERAIPYAEAIANHASGKLLFVSGFAPNSSYAAFAASDPAIFEEQMGQGGKIDDYLKQVTARSERRGLKAEYVYLRKTAAEAIIQVASESRDRIVVMTSHGASGVRRWLLGSVADKVIRSSEHPVIVIPPEHQQVSYRGGAARRP